MIWGSARVGGRSSGRRWCLAACRAEAGVFPLGAIEIFTYSNPFREDFAFDRASVASCLATRRLASPGLWLK